jgi:hypothetical protein
MPSSGMLRRVALIRTDVSEERSAYIIRVTSIEVLGTMLAVTTIVSIAANLVTLMMEAIRSSTTSVLTRAARRHVSEGVILQVT